MNNEKTLLAASIRHNVFASRNTVEEALEYASATIERCLYNDDRAAMYTALYVVLNTVADKITALPDQLPEPPAEVRIAHADLPDTGATTLHDQIEDIVLAQISKLGVSIDQKIERAIEEWSENAPLDTIIEEWFDDNVDIEYSVKEIISTLSISIDVE